MIRHMKMYCDGLPSCGSRGAGAEFGIRLLAHPEQFIVLSSDSANVVANSIQALRMHARILDMLGTAPLLRLPMELHGGKCDRQDALVRVIESGGGYTFAPDPGERRGRVRAGRYWPCVGARTCRWCSTRITTSAIRNWTVTKHPSVAEMFWAARETWPAPNGN